MFVNYDECYFAVGNGPSGICLSYMLSGNWPYITATAHPDEMLMAKLQDIDLTKSLLLQVDYIVTGRSCIACL